MHEIERIAAEIFEQFNLAEGHPTRVLICHAVKRAKDGDAPSAWWILKAFEEGWEYGSCAFKRPYDSAYQRHGENNPSQQTELVRAIGHLWQAVNNEVNKR